MDLLPKEEGKKMNQWLMDLKTKKDEDEMSRAKEAYKLFKMGEDNKSVIICWEEGQKPFVSFLSFSFGFMGFLPPVVGYYDMKKFNKYKLKERERERLVGL